MPALVTRRQRCWRGRELPFSALGPGGMVVTHHAHHSGVAGLSRGFFCSIGSGLDSRRLRSGVGLISVNMISSCSAASAVSIMTRSGRLRPASASRSKRIETELSKHRAWRARPSQLIQLAHRRCPQYTNYCLSDILHIGRLQPRFSTAEHRKYGHVP